MLHPLQAHTDRLMRLCTADYAQLRLERGLECTTSPENSVCIICIDIGVGFMVSFGTRVFCRGSVPCIMTFGGKVASECLADCNLSMQSQAQDAWQLVCPLVLLRIPMCCICDVRIKMLFCCNQQHEAPPIPWFSCRGVDLPKKKDMDTADCGCMQLARTWS